jgi:hypothetical protein
VTVRDVDGRKRLVFRANPRNDALRFRKRDERIDQDCFSFSCKKRNGARRERRLPAIVPGWHETYDWLVGAYENVKVDRHVNLPFPSPSGCRAAFLGVALLAAAIAIGAPTLASAQEQVSSADTGNVAVTRLDRETYTLATMRQQIPQDTIAVVPIEGLDGVQRQMLLGDLTPPRAAALRNALSQAVVATEDRPNGISEDQETLADYLTSVGINPDRVVAVSIARNADRENPPVTVYYRAHRSAS